MNQKQKEIIKSNFQDGWINQSLLFRLCFPKLAKEVRIFAKYHGIKTWKTIPDLLTDAEILGIMALEGYKDAEHALRAKRL